MPSIDRVALLADDPKDRRRELFPGNCECLDQRLKIPRRCNPTDEEEQGSRTEDRIPLHDWGRIDTRPIEHVEVDSIEIHRFRYDPESFDDPSRCETAGGNHEVRRSGVGRLGPRCNPDVHPLRKGREQTWVHGTPSGRDVVDIRNAVGEKVRRIGMHVHDVLPSQNASRLRPSPEVDDSVPPHAFRRDDGRWQNLQRGRFDRFIVRLKRHDRHVVHLPDASSEFVHPGVDSAAHDQGVVEECNPHGQSTVLKR